MEPIVSRQHIRIELRNGAAHRLFVERDAFLLSKADSIHFDQVTGTDMTGYFVDNESFRAASGGYGGGPYRCREFP
ncbi:MAG: hypothetical protein IPI81_11435 [Flavobacteriales bacterium]|nr:hypothetical protein [Flavobacteriales bacterium]